MPESPEVQALVEFLDQRVTGRVITQVEVTEFRVVKTRDRPLASLAGARVTAVRRFGKHLGMRTSAGWLVIGFGRNGWIQWRDPGQPSVDAPEVVRITLDDSSLIQVVENGDFLAVTAAVVDDPADVSGIAGLGPDPLDAAFSRDDLERALGARRKQIKSLLQEQASLTGIGNAYSDEILHRARLPHPVHANALDADARQRLFDSIVAVMRGAVEDRRGLAPGRLKPAKVEAMVVHGRAGEPCPVCGTTIAEHTFAGASAQFCPRCHARADRVTPNLSNA